MIVLDENIRHDQGNQLRKWRIPFRLLIRDLARPGIQDPDVIPLLHNRKHSTLFTHDQDYFQRKWVHPAYCLVWLDVFDGDAALFIRRFLRNPAFNTHAKRMGKVVRVHSGGAQYWQFGENTLQSAKWE